MFQNRFVGFVPSTSMPAFVLPATAAPTPAQPARHFGMPVQISDIYQAAKNRAVEDHELDKLFNPDFYDYQI